MIDIRKKLRKTFYFRTAVRVYKDQKIPQEDLDLILDAAWRSPSSVGLEGWRFVNLKNQAVKEELKAISWGATSQLETASDFILILAEKNARYDGQSMRQSLIRRGITDPEAIDARLKTYQSFQKVDMDMLTSPRVLFEWTARQTYIALGNMMTCAALLGIDSCPIEGFDHAKVNDILAKHGIISADKEGISCMLSLGYRLKDPKHPHTRKDRDQVITTFN
ncbi:NAD(P)H-dependent oxidoreductase [Streptococcus didelphis]|uniref:NAD(P)H-dependent oxidoreductase n=1 Tax=Streptococcus didelphis TaxID=102886 RepID=A0ABY9LI62_9STRE|nr:NAD(P)H-dependent oxidoreductase [Streptococcus didelphis]WMB28480.1 NAD(P)H-dependent oxidoreductase [Streptococcus didelphis]